MNHQQTGKALPGRPHGFTDQVPTSLWCPFLQENQEPGRLCLYSWLNFCCYCCCFLCFCGQNKPELIKKERAQSSRQLRSNSAARPLAEVTKKHHQQKGKHPFGRGSPQLVQCWETHTRLHLLQCHHSGGGEQCGEALLLPSSQPWGTQDQGTGPLCSPPTGLTRQQLSSPNWMPGVWVVNSYVNLKSCSPHTHISGPFCEGIKKKISPPSPIPGSKSSSRRG